MKAVLLNWIILEWTIDEIITVLKEVKEVKEVKRRLWYDDWMDEMKHDYPYTEQDLWNVSSSESWPWNPATY